jgi:hypothetical protein
MPRATARGQTRAGLSEDELVEDLVALAGSGTNVVTTAVTFSREAPGSVLPTGLG